MSSLQKKAIFGLSWTMLEYFLLLIFQLSLLAVLARILKPEDFGIFAIGTFFSTLGNSVFAMGMGPAIIQRSGNVNDYLDTAWSANLLISLFLFLFLLLIIPTIVNYYFSNNEAVLPSLILSSIVLISGFNNIGIVVFMKKIELKNVFFYNIFPKATGVIFAILFSILLQSYWGLIVGLIVESIFRAMISYKLSPYRPKFKIDRNKFIELYSFGGWLQLKNIISWFANNLDTFIIGIVTSVGLLGFYNRAITIARLPQNQIVKVVNTVIFPLYSSIKNDKNRIQLSVNATNDLVLLLLFPIILASVFFGDFIIIIFLGDNWIEMTETFQLLIIAIAYQAYFISYVPLIRSMGFSKVEFYYFLIKIAILIFLLYPLTLKFSINGAAYAIIIANLLASPYIIWNIIRLTPISFRTILESLSVCVISSIAVIFLMNIFNFNENESLIITGLYLMMMLLLFFMILYGFYKLFNKGPFISIQKTLAVFKKKYINKNIL